MSISSTKAFRIECTLHNDPRLLVGLSALAGRAALHAGFSEEEQLDVSARTWKACREVFSDPDLKGDPAAAIRVFLEFLGDRFEIKIDPQINGSPARVACAKLCKTLQPAI
jgi:hypothetical protein